MRIAYNNLVDGIATSSISALTTNSSFPVANMQDQRLTTKWRSTSLTVGGTAQTLTVDLGETRGITTAAIIGHNIDLGYFQNIQRLSSETNIRSLSSLGSGVVLAGTSPTGQIFKSSDYGDTWANIQRLGTEVEVLSLSSLGSGIVLAGTSTTGEVYKSADSGDTWALIQQLGSETSVQALVSLGSGIVIAGTGATGQIYKSTDSGDNWSNIQRLGTETNVRSLAFLGSGVVLAGTGTTGLIYKSTDSGDTWALIQRLGSESNVRSIVSLGSGIVIAGTGSSGQIYKSTDSGDTWTLVQRLGSETEVWSLVSPVTNTVFAGTGPTGQVYKSTDAGDSWTVVQRLGAETSVRSLSFLGVGVVLAGTGVTGQIYKTETNVTISGNASAVWTSPSVTETLVWNEDIILKYFSEQHYRYWQFSIANSTNELAHVEIGRIWLGEYIDISPSSLDDFTVINKRSDLVQYGRNRQKWSDPGIGWREIQLSFPPTATVMTEKILTMFDTVGNHTSLVFSNFDTIRNYKIVEPMYCSIVGELSHQHRGRQRYNWDLTLEEDR